MENAISRANMKWQELLKRIRARFKNAFYRREVEIFWDAVKKDTYGIREVWRSKVAIQQSEGLKWRNYSDGYGNTIRLTQGQMEKLLKEAEGFVKNRQ